MRKLIFILSFIGLSIFGKSQSTTVATSGGKILLYGSNQYGKQVGYFMFDSTAGTFVRSGNQVNLFRSYMKYNNALQRRLTLAENIIQYIEKDGSIRYPIEFKAAVELWMKENQQY